MQKCIVRWLGEETAATAVEYAVMLALLLGVALGSILILGQDTKQLWNSNNTSMQAVGFGS